MDVHIFRVLCTFSKLKMLASLRRSIAMVIVSSLLVHGDVDVQSSSVLVNSDVDLQSSPLIWYHHGMHT